MRQPSFAQLLEIENDPAFLTFRCPRSGALLWPLVRNQFYRQLISDLYYQEAPLIAAVPAVPRGQALASLARVARHNLGQRRLSGDVLVIGTGAGSFLREGRWFNRITDYLAQASPPDTVTVEGVVDWNVPRPRWNQRISYWLPWQGAITVAGRLLQRDSHVETAREVLAYARQRAHDLLDLSIAETQMDMLVGMLARKLARLPVVHHAYRRLLEKVRPRLILLEQACYGDFSPINQIAREMGIRVAEPQHGMVSGGHDAYCYAPLLRDSAEYKACLPHDFLGYGSWWNKQINVPVEKWVIGHPHYSEQRRGMSLAKGVQNDILLLGDGIEFPLYVALATELAELLRGQYRIVLRPHPLERVEVYRRYPDGKIGDVFIDTNRDIYSSFISAHAVAGEVSTGLFEAIGIAGKVLLWETPKAQFSYPSHPFSGFVDAKGFVEELLKPEGSGLPVIDEDIWASDWVSNYKNYLGHVLDKAG
ncbi:hypothetical protein KJF94_22275 [Pseudomonas hormoni]|uniref:Capsular biosynthesis protein n=1 Tax=Pseudomonas hormoni TaxID=3093767 RepID=A0ABX8ERX1_9PSED|nr:hypothetical protein [Pseudomonas hormoni]QVW22562.1 hypothetical protein KJF94_22275 [Pseudomonas hormoni]